MYRSHELSLKFKGKAAARSSFHCNNFEWCDHALLSLVTRLTLVNMWSCHAPSPFSLCTPGLTDVVGVLKLGWEGATSMLIVQL